ncbi:hypothetical protein [Desulfotomaculum sp. 1211_IL3151]|uniref:hypothetical protein n=1 Tax=Desulfotomaculum sp. 1211_IL3151 TaxID=3084055 RepID=UPI002FD8E2F5
MALYLDLDLDYFVYPIIKEAVTNHRPSCDDIYALADPSQLLSIIKQKNIFWSEKRFIFSNHMQSHLRWWLNGKLNNTVIHIDAHSDLYGHRLRDLSNLKMLGCQNFLWHSIREGLVSEIFWVFPDNAVDLTKENLVYDIFTTEQLNNFYLKDNVLNIELNCLLPGNKPKTIHYHLLKAEDLPVFEETVEITTVATSPEFIPRQADSLIVSIGQWLKLSPSLIENILMQHRAMKTQGK